MEHEIIQRLTGELGSQAVLTGSALEGRYSHIWKMDDPLRAMAVALPRDTKEVSTICRICNEARQSIVVHGGLTGLVGATQAERDQIVISLERLNRIEEIDEMSRTMTVEAGVILEDIQEAALKKNLFFPLSFGAKGSAQIGGCISTNAGGLRVLRYGMTRNAVLGLETVLADGTIIRSLKKIIKDNSGYNLNQLFIGSEGTLGIVTRAVLRLEEKPLSRNSAFIGFDNYAKVVTFLKCADAKLSGQLSGFEILWSDTYQALTSLPSRFNPPVKHGYLFYVLIETLGGDQERDRMLLESMLEKSLQSALFLDAAMAHTAAENEWFWNIREDMGIINNLSSYPQHFDISISIDAIGAYVSRVKEELIKETGVMHCYSFGHLADGNIHFIVGKKSDDEVLKARINKIVYAPLQDLDGSVSAEHGIGLDKKDWLPTSRTKEEIELMRQMKKAMDPNCILNPGRILDAY